MTRWLLIGLGVLVMVALALLVAGMLRPASHEASVSLRLAAPPDSVWRIISDIEGQPAWVPQVRAVERLPDNAGRPAYRENFDGFEAMTVITESVPHRKLVKEILPTGPFSGTWTWELDGDSTHTTLAITERGTVGNVFLRGMMVFHDNEASLRAYGAALERRLVSGER